MKDLKLFFHNTAQFIRKYFRTGIGKIPWLNALGVDRVERITAVIVCILLVIIILSIAIPERAQQGQNWIRVQKGHFTVDLIESGDVEAVSQFLISAPMMWGEQLKVVEVVPEGSLVKKGDVILQFDVSDLQDEKQIREDRLESLKADMEKLKAQQALTISNMKNSLRLAEYSYEQAELRLEMRKYESQARQEEARLQLKQAEIELKKVRTQLESQYIIHTSQLVKNETQIREAVGRVTSINDRIGRLILKAPADGMIVYEQVRGERVKEGYEARPGWPLMSIPDLKRLRVKVFVNEVDRLDVGMGQEAEIELDAYPEMTYHGRVREVSRLAQVVTGEESLKGFVVYIDIDGTAPELKPGLTARVRIILDELEDVLSVPLSVVYEIDGQPVVFPVRRSKPHAVYLGPRNEGYVVVERGLEYGMRLTWAPPEADIFPLGASDERQRIDALAQTVRESFDVFEERGILYDYIESEDTIKSSDSSIDLDNLPAAIRNRLKNREADDGSSEPKLEVGSPGRRKKEGTFRVSPSMMKRLEKKPEDVSSSESKE